MKVFRHLPLSVFVFGLLALCSCGPFGAGPWYAIYQSTQKSKDDTGTIRITYGPEVSALTNTSATIEWVTDIQSDSTVTYGLDTTYGSQEKDAALDTVHSVTLSSLSSDTTYHFRVTSVAASGASGASADKQFTTKVALVVTSAYGPTTPDNGTHYYDSSDDVFATAPATVDGPAKTRYRCTGYSGTGSAPASGTGSSAYFTITQDSTITWNWVTQYCLTTSTNPIGSGTVACSPLGNWHDDGSAPEVTAAGTAGYAFVNWTGDLSGSTNPDSVTMDAPKTVVANFTGETFDLDVASAWGSPDPAVGVHFCASGANIDASVDSPVSGGAGIRYVCTGWSGTGDVPATGGTSSVNFTITQDSTITWNWKTQYQLTTVIDPVGGGTVSRNPDAAWYDSGTPVQLTAAENTGFTFNDWTGGLTGNTNPDSITMDSAKTVTAHFSGGGTLWTLTVTSTYGTPEPPSGDVADGTLVDASVDSTVYPTTPGTRYACTGWSGTGDVPSTGGTNSTSFTITQDSTLTWNWKTQYQLTTSVIPVGGGSIGRSPDAAWYDENTDVDLTANPNASYVFDSWSGGLAGSINPDTITMNAPKSVTATFITTTYTLTVASAYGSPDPPDGSEFTSGTNVAASVASPVAGPAGTRYVCTGWSGAGSVPSSGTTNSVNFDIMENSSITWNWKTQYELAVTLSPPGGGTVDLDPPGGWYDPPTSVQLTVNPDASYNFTGWSGDLTGSTNPENLNVDAPKSVTANFELQATVIRVPTDYGTIQQAINNSTDGDTVLVADGTYTGAGNKDLTLGSRKITVRSENGPENCIIDCQNDGRGFYLNSTSAQATIQGFTITNGVAADGKGGGMRFYSSHTTVTGCIITDCTSFSYGGGIYCDGSNPVFDNCTIKNNTAVTGAGIYMKWGSPTVSNCVIMDNTAEREAGGICTNYVSCCPAITNCIITGNSVTGGTAYPGGAGISCHDSSSPELTNCLIAGNNSTSYGGGVRCHDDSTCTLTNCTVANNTADRGGGISCSGSASSLTVNNTIIWGNSASLNGNQIYNTATTTADYCCYADGADDIYGTVTETSCIHTDPLLVSLTGANYRLMKGSPCINTGSNSYADAGDKDLDGKDRIVDTTVDMGAYEFNALNVPSAFTTIQAAIDAAGKGDTVVVADNTYTGTGNRDLDFSGKLIVVCSENGPTNCVIDCQDAGRGFYFHTGEGLGSVVTGFTITNGSASDDGGGICCIDTSSPTIASCILDGNSAATYGAGIYCETDSNPVIKDCVIINNTTLPTGGGGTIYCNYASPTISNCLIANNTGRSAGGIFCRYSDARITNCAITGNTATNTGGGIYCIFSAPVITNCTIADNTAGINGGGMQCHTDGTPILNNTVFWGNTATSNGNQIYHSASSTIITLVYCDYDNGTNDVEGVGTVNEVGVCIYSDPLFVDSIGGDYRLSGGPLLSPCVDAGDSSLVPPGVDTDLAGEPRACGASVDIGAYEGQWLPVPSVWTTIQSAIDDALTGAVVIVADGTYTGTGNKDLDFGGKAITVRSENGATGCTIDCEFTCRAFNFHSAEGNDSVVNGFTIINGSATGDGGGINCVAGADPTIANCYITNCTASLNGGGIGADSVHPIISYCTITSCSAASYGGAIGYDHCDGTIINCTITNNTAQRGGGIYLIYAGPAITGCVIENNTADTHGGGIYCWASMSDPTITNCIIQGNSVTGSSVGHGGGGVYCYNSAHATLVNCLVVSNTTAEDGGGVFCNTGGECTLTNCTVADNDAYAGGAISAKANSSVTLFNTIIWANTGSMVWSEIYLSNSTATADYCDLPSSGVSPSVTQTNCISADPLFVTGPGGDYYLSQIAAGQGADSPCLDAGSATAASLGLDTKTTRTDTVTDTGTVDTGYHYDP